ncbi:hypothetical protein AB1Y20_012941 [Prymnesium parvum]|uniref:Sulfhydryl oxidase n=1 Tax=Prymnesium parvum TaxID=97485 RepID=A0AB34IJ98_PRYPA
MDKSCVEPICASKKDAMKSMFAQKGKGQAASKSTSAALSPCPPDREELGTHSWTLLHTMAAYYPEQPTDEQRTAARAFIDSLSKLYACTHCAEHFREEIREDPPRVESRAALSVWMCKAHNRVNSMLGKPEFECVLEKLDRRWRTGEAHCHNGLADDHYEAE